MTPKTRGNCWPGGEKQHRLFVSLQKHPIEESIMTYQAKKPANAGCDFDKFEYSSLFKRYSGTYLFMNGFFKEAQKE